MKTKQKKEPNPDLKYTELSRTENNFTQFSKLLNEDRLAARVFGIERKVFETRHILFDQAPTKFQIVVEKTKYGVSKTLKRYVTRTRPRSITVNNNKFYVLYLQDEDTHRERKLIRPLSLHYLSVGCYGYGDKELEILKSRFDWVQFIQENNIQLTFNTICSKKLFDLKKCLTYQYKAPYPVAKKLHDILTGKENLSNIYGYNHSFNMMAWKEMIKVMTNIENLNFDLISGFQTLIDTTKMATKLNKKVNAAWSFRRLKQEHDIWARDIANYLFSAEDRELKVHERFKPVIEAMTEAELLDTTKKLALEGLVQNHCVAGYTGTIEQGRSVIFHYKGYTLEIKCKNKDSVYATSMENPTIFYINQFRGRHNNEVPTELMKEVNNILTKINLNNEPNELEKQVTFNGVFQQAILDNQHLLLNFDRQNPQQVDNWLLPDPIPF